MACLMAAVAGWPAHCMMWHGQAQPLLQPVMPAQSEAPSQQQLPSPQQAGQAEPAAAPQRTSAAAAQAAPAAPLAWPRRWPAAGPPAQVRSRAPCSCTRASGRATYIHECNATRPAYPAAQPGPGASRAATPCVHPALPAASCCLEHCSAAPHLMASSALVCTVAFSSCSSGSRRGMMPPSMKVFCAGGRESGRADSQAGGRRAEGCLRPRQCSGTRCAHASHKQEKQQEQQRQGQRQGIHLVAWQCPQPPAAQASVLLTSAPA